MPRQSKAFPPFYLLQAPATCPDCLQTTNVYALVAHALYDPSEDGEFDGPLILKDIERLPKRTLHLLQPRCPGWEFDRVPHRESPCLTNHCRHCNARLTDHYLHDEPGAAFFPCSPEECWNISRFTLPDTGPVPIHCSWTAGGLTEWLDEYVPARPLTEL